MKGQKKNAERTERSCSAGGGRESDVTFHEILQLGRSPLLRPLGHQRKGRARALALK
jgi:hypothetical protein